MSDPRSASQQGSEFADLLAESHERPMLVCFRGAEKHWEGGWANADDFGWRDPARWAAESAEESFGLAVEYLEVDVDLWPDLAARHGFSGPPSVELTSRGVASGVFALFYDGAVIGTLSALEITTRGRVEAFYKQGLTEVMLRRGDRSLVRTSSTLGRVILRQAEDMGCLSEVESRTDLQAIRLIQKWEGHTPCFGRAVPLNVPWDYPHVPRPAPQEGDKCGELACIWREACDAYRTSESFIPIEREFPDLSGQELDDFKARIHQLDRSKDPHLANGQVGMKLRDFRKYSGLLDSATKKLLGVAPRVVVGEQLTDLRKYVFSVESSAGTGPVHSAGDPMFYAISQDVVVFYSSDAPRVRQYLVDTAPFQDSGQLAYYPLIETQHQERELEPRARPSHLALLKGIQWSEDFAWWDLDPTTLPSFDAPYLGLPDGTIRLSHPEYAPLFSLQLPCFDTDYDTLKKVMDEHEDTLGPFRDFLTGSMDETRDSFIGSEQYGRDLRRIDREISGQLRKLESDLRKARLTTAFTAGGIGFGAFALSVYAIAKQQGDLLAFLGPGGVVTSAGAALSKRLIDRYELRDNPVYFLWELGKAQAR